jgi:hypothetical protein
MVYEKQIKIASVTMVGQFPHGIKYHVENMKWALDQDSHIFIVTLPSIIEEQKLEKEKSVTYIPFETEKKEGFINFWRSFPEIVKKYKIDPEYFLFTEQDIWFFEKLNYKEEEKTIVSYLPTGGYRNIILNDKLFHPRVWEGGQIINASIVKDAIQFGIDFSFVKETFLDKRRSFYENKFNGKIEFSMYKDPDTFDEFGLYCALEAGTNIKQMIKACHLRGPESVHRIFPEMYHFASAEKIKKVQKKIPYIDIYMVIAVYYIVGLWIDIKDINWEKAKEDTKKDLKKLLSTSKEWMKEEENSRMKEIVSLMK